MIITIRFGERSIRFGKRHHFRSCLRKISYRHKETACRVAIAMEEKTGRKFDVYECVACGEWHIGKAAA